LTNSHTECKNSAEQQIEFTTPSIDRCQESENSKITLTEKSELTIVHLPVASWENILKYKLDLADGSCLQDPGLQAGMKWTEGLLSMEPIWTLDPCLDAIAEVAAEELFKHNLIAASSNPVEASIEFYGAFNKLYSIALKDNSKDESDHEHNDTSYLMRVALPVDPKATTLSETATINFLQRNTTIPVPGIISYSSSRQESNKIGFEWILMERVPDAYPLRKIWQSMTWAAKEKLVEDICDIVYQLFHIRSDAIGSIYQLQTSCLRESFRVSQLVTLEIFWNDHVHLEISRGPFASTKEWLYTRLQLVLHDCQMQLAIDLDKREFEKEYSEIQGLACRLLAILPTIFSAANPEEFSLLHDDLSGSNIVVDQSGALKAVVDWECTSTMPLFKCCQMPQLLLGEDRDEIPDHNLYDMTGDRRGWFEDLEEYEFTRLREHFLHIMQARYPSWAEIHHDKGIQAQFDLMISKCNRFDWEEVKEWIDEIEGRVRNDIGDS